jgi:hypothetical protein
VLAIFLVELGHSPNVALAPVPLRVHNLVLAIFLVEFNQLSNVALALVPLDSNGLADNVVLSLKVIC